MNFKSICSSLFFACLCVSASSYAAKTNPKKSPNPKSTIGFLAGVSGDVKVDDKVVKSGDSIRLSSKIQTGAQGKLQVLLGDGMVALLGHNTTVRLEKYHKPNSKIGPKSKVAKVSALPKEYAQIELQKGSLRFLVKKDENYPRQGKIRSGKDFALVNHGEAYFLCDEACAKKLTFAKNRKK